VTHCSEVFKARVKDEPAKKFVAMKKVLMDNEKEGVKPPLPIFPKLSHYTIGPILVPHHGPPRDQDIAAAKA
jgi:aspartate oxidase